MKKILAIGGAVIKTAKEELRQVIEADKIEILIHNGGSIFHDFQQIVDNQLKDHSYPLSDLLKNYSQNEYPSKLVWNWVNGGSAPGGSITDLCFKKGIEVLMFTGQACDFWQLFAGPEDWAELGRDSYFSFRHLVTRFREPFHYICMGSAVIHPEVFIKAIAEAHSKEFTADVVDFKDMYRPRTRVSKFGTYYKTSHKEFLAKWLTEL